MEMLAGVLEVEVEVVPHRANAACATGPAGQQLEEEVALVSTLFELMLHAPQGQQGSS